MPLTLKVINLWCGPGGGKSTTAAALFYMMKQRGDAVELVTEYAKELTYQQDWEGLRHQLSILGEQDRRLRRLEGRSEWAITDSPLPIGLPYTSEEYRAWLEPAYWGAFYRYHNFNVSIRRVKPYQTQGRNQTEEEAKGLDNLIRMLWTKAVVGTDDHMTLDGDGFAAKNILEALDGFARHPL